MIYIEEIGVLKATFGPSKSFSCLRDIDREFCKGEEGKGRFSNSRIVVMVDEKLPLENEEKTFMIMYQWAGWVLQSSVALESCFMYLDFIPFT